jgi:phosphoribosylaminoimidazolecarboxamide formyltransferase / IMP cyclohydrolase
LQRFSQAITSFSPHSMSDSKKIGAALVSVFHKDGLEPVIRQLADSGVKLYATGGTQDFITSLGYPVIAVEDVTDYPSILGGRVKTLHPKVFGGILRRSDNEDDLMQMEKFNIPSFDLVIVDLYPFSKTLERGGSHQEIIEKIDIGGISLIRAAAKNFNDVLIISSMEDYAELLTELQEKEGYTSLSFRKKMAARAFAVSSSYDTAIWKWMSDGDTTTFHQAINQSTSLRYGENPHQSGIFYGNPGEVFEQLSGKELSYNNLLDIDAALSLAADFKKPVTAILKHNNACGVATGNDPYHNWKTALEADPVSAFGGIIVTTSEIDQVLAAEIGKLFFEVLIAPAFSQEALDILRKKNRILLKLKEFKLQDHQFRTILNGVLWQDRDRKTENESDLRPVTNRKPDHHQVNDLLFANIVVKHSRSNTIVLAKDSRLIAAGVGQTSRVDALHQAIEKAHRFGLNLQGAVMASDAFFPFPDCVEIAHKVGITAVIQPGGSKKDQESIDYCNANDIAMVLTGIRHFRH